MSNFNLCKLPAIVLLATVACQSPRGGSGTAPRTIKVAQSGAADVTGSDSAALKKAAALLRAGDTLEIGAGTYTMDDSLLIPSNVSVRGVKGQTILRKSRGVSSLLAEDGDYGESQLRVAEPDKFRPGMGISVLDDTLNQGWDISVTSITAVEGNLLRIHPMTLRDYDLEQKHARVQSTFPILCVMDGENVVIEDLMVDGNKAENAYIDGCRGGAIYMYRARNVTVRNCVARDYNGDGISFQITSNIQVLNSESHGHTGFGVHPGTGSDRPVVKGNRLHHNGQIGLFLCWRVRHGEFSDNVIEDNGEHGISIGHKDTDNVFVNNRVARNGMSGVYFRKESFLNSGHRNQFRNNEILDNGNAQRGYGFYIEPHAGDIVIEDNRIADSRKDKPLQRHAVYKAKGAGAVEVRNNKTEGRVEGM